MRKCRASKASPQGPPRSCASKGRNKKVWKEIVLLSILLFLCFWGSIIRFADNPPLVFSLSLKNIPPHSKSRVTRFAYRVFAGENSRRKAKPSLSAVGPRGSLRSPVLRCSEAYFLCGKKALPPIILVRLPNSASSPAFFLSSAGRCPPIWCCGRALPLFRNSSSRQGSSPARSVRGP